MPPTLDPPAAREPFSQQLGPALRHLRLLAGKKQFEIADSAGVTRAMLSAYENSHQEPTLSTLVRILDALDADLVKLQWALGITAATPEGSPAAAGGAQTPSGEGTAPPPPRSRSLGGAGPVVYRVLDLPDELTAEEETALGEMVAGFLSWVRFMRRDRSSPGPGAASGSEPRRDPQRKTSG